MPESIVGLPVHPLVVHATVVIVPAAALAVLLAAVLPRVRAWAGPLPMVLAVVGLVLAPLSTSSGWVPSSPGGAAGSVEPAVASAASRLNDPGKMPSRRNRT